MDVEQGYQSRSEEGAGIQQGSGTSIPGFDVNINRRLHSDDRRIGLHERRTYPPRRRNQPSGWTKPSVILRWLKKMFGKEIELIPTPEEEREDTDTRNKNLKSIFDDSRKKLNVVLNEIDKHDKSKH